MYQSICVGSVPMKEIFCNFLHKGHCFHQLMALAKETKPGLGFKVKCVFPSCTSLITEKLLNLKWETRPIQLLGSFPFAFTLLVYGRN